MYIGIDLGTTFSVVSYYKNNTLYFIEDESGNVLIPSVVCYALSTYVGRDAIEQEEDYPQETIRSSKRSIGINQSLHPTLNISPTLVATDILKYLKKITENQLQEDIEGVVITVPAYFNHNQRLQTKQAAIDAGLNVLRIINEPTAAALAYGNNNTKEELILVFDLGGGTFDVTLLKLSDDNMYQVLSTSGNTALGGDDFDNLIINEFIKTLPKHFKPFKDFKVKLKKFAEEIKIQLNYKNSIKRTLKYCGTINSKIYHHEFFITDELYCNIIQKLLLKTKMYVLNALNDADKKISSLSKIILVGGSTKSKYIREYIKKEFNTKIYHDIDPDLTVAAGASILANTITNKDKEGTLLIDVTSLSLGIETKGGIMNKIIPRNSSIPVTSSQDFFTVEDNQTSVLIKIYQGERPIAKDNELLGEFELSGFEKRPRGQTIIVIKFEIDASGLIHVSAYDKISGLKSDVTLNPLTSESVNNLLDEIELYQQDDEFIKKQIILNQLQTEVKTLILKKILNGVDEKELYETYDSVKDDLNNLNVFAQSLKFEII